MNRNIESLAVINKNLTSKRVLKSTQTTFEVYRPEYFSFTKAVDRPDDYYFEGDLMLLFCSGVLVGAFLGMLIIALCSANDRSDK